MPTDGILLAFPKCLGRAVIGRDRLLKKKKKRRRGGAAFVLFNILSKIRVSDCIKKYKSRHKDCTAKKLLISS